MVENIFEWQRISRGLLEDFKVNKKRKRSDSNPAVFVIPLTLFFVADQAWCYLDIGGPL